MTWNPWSSVSQGSTVPGGVVTAVPWGNQFALFLADPNGGIYTTSGSGESFVLGPAVGDLLDISRPFDAPPITYDTSDPNWSANVVGRPDLRRFVQPCVRVGFGSHAEGGAA